MDNKYSKLKAAYEASAPQMPADFTDKVMKRVNKRRRSSLGLWLSSAAAVVVVLMVVGTMLWPHHENVAKTTVAHIDTTFENAEQEQPIVAAQSTITEKTVQAKLQSRQRQVGKAQPIRRMTSIDSLADIVARLEVEMQGISDSCYLANVEKLIKADDQLQKLVNNLILDGILSDTITRVAIIDNP